MTVISQSSRTPLRSSLPATPFLIFTAFLFLGGVYLTYLARMPHWDWNAARVLPSVAMAEGHELYYGPESGPIMSTLYGPVKALLYLPAALATTPTGALAIAGLLNYLVLLIPIALLVRDRDRLRWLSAFALGAGALLVWRATRYMTTKIHVDAPAVGLGLLACWVLIDRGKAEGDSSPTRSRFFVAALLTVLAAWTKQVQAPLAFALLAYVGLAWGRRAAGQLFLCLAATAIAVSGAFLLLFDAHAMVFNILTVPAQHPYLGGKGLGVLMWLGLSTIELMVKSSLFLLVVLVALRFRPPETMAQRLRHCPWLVLVLAGIGTWPTSVLGRAIIGGDENSYHSLAYFLMAAVLATARGDVLPDSPRRGDLLLVGGALIVSLLAVVRLGSPVEIWTWQDNPQQQAYEYALQHPEDAYFPWNPLSTLLAEGRLDHFDYNVYDRGLAGYPLSEEHFRAHLPPDPLHVFFHEDAQDRHVMDHLPGYSEQTTVPEMPQWIVFQRPGE